MLLAELQDVEALTGRTIVAASDIARVSRLLELASALVAAAEPGAATESPTSDLVRFVVADVARAGLTNPEGVESETTGSYTVAFGATALELTDAHRTMLRNHFTPAASPRGGMVSVPLTAPGW